jgi:hypothetical protein
MGPPMKRSLLYTTIPLDDDSNSDGDGDDDDEDNETTTPPAKATSSTRLHATSSAIVAPAAFAALREEEVGGRMLTA